MLHQNAMQVRTYTKLPLKFVSEIAEVSKLMVILHIHCFKDILNEFQLNLDKYLRWVLAKYLQ